MRSSESTFQKVLFSSILAFATLAAWSSQAEVAESRISLGQTSANQDVLMKSTEVGFGISSVNAGTSYGLVSYWNEFNPGVAVGARLGIPMNFSSEDQNFLAQLAARFFLVNTVNMIFLDAHLSLAAQTTQEVGTDVYPGLGLDYGYKREINRNVAIGGSLGLDYLHHDTGSNARGGAAAGWNLFSQANLFGAYYF